MTEKEIVNVANRILNVAFQNYMSLQTVVTGRLVAHTKWREWRSKMLPITAINKPVYTKKRRI